MYETGLERCGENLTDSGPASTKGESMINDLLLWKLPERFLVGLCWGLKGPPNNVPLLPVF